MIGRSREAIRRSDSLETDDDIERVNGGQEVPSVLSHSSTRSRIRRPPGFKHHLRGNKRKYSGINKSIKRMRIKSSDEKVAKIELVNNKTKEEIPANVKQQSKFSGRVPSQ